MAKKNYKLKKIYSNNKAGIFLVEFDHPYLLAMTFLRYQEYYESDNSAFKGKEFTILDYIEWYSKKNNNCFTYPNDWVGFNVPDWVIAENLKTIIDYNKYDLCMRSIYLEIKKHKCDMFYLIGTCKNQEDVKHHEIAHGMYYISKEYREEMDMLYSYIPENYIKKINKHFKNLGYDQSVWKDETQAYLSTQGYLSTEKEFLTFDNVIHNKFSRILRKYLKLCKM